MKTNESDFAVVPINRTRDNVLMKFHLKIRKPFFNVRDIKQVAQDGCGVCICDVIQNLTGRSPGQPALAGAP